MSAAASTVPSLQQPDLRACRVLDGGLATELEKRGVSLAGPLWSARALRDAPEAILAVHRDYLEAGADCLLTASYQASALGYAEAFAHAENVPGFEVGADLDEPTPGGSEVYPEAAVEFSVEMRILAMARAAARAALVTSVRLALEARTAYHSEGHTRPILVAASLGPYGAALHNGAEFHGNYGQTTFADLVAFHRERIAVLAGAGPDLQADLLAFETVPSLEEARAIVAALGEFPQLSAWITFSCRDEEKVAHGESLRSCARFLDGVVQIIGVGVNCTAPALITPLLGELRAGTRKPLIVYPNSGEGWDAVRKCWTGVPDIEGYGALAQQWYDAGAQIAGGCCRTGPAHIRAVAEAAPPPARPELPDQGLP